MCIKFVLGGIRHRNCRKALVSPEIRANGGDRPRWKGAMAEKGWLIALLFDIGQYLLRTHFNAGRN